MKSNIFIKISMVALIALSGLSCDTQGFRDLDIPKHDLTQQNADMSMMFTRTIIDYGRDYIGTNPYRLEANALKYYATYSLIGSPGGLNQFTQGVNDGSWGLYTSGLINTATMEDYLLKLNDPNQVNNLAMVRILKAVIYQRLTDFHGDIPYSEASQLALSAFELNKPAYDTQEFIYKDILAILEREAANITTSGNIMAVTWTGADLSYGGNMERWRKFAYSLMLRMAMRMSDVDETTARRYAELAISKGVIVDNADNYQMKTGTSTSPDERNSYSQYLAGEGGGDPERYMKFGEYFVNFLKEKNHPIRKIYFGGRLIQSIPETQATATYMTQYWRDITKWDWNLDEATGMIHGTMANPEPSVAAYMKKYTSPNPFLFTNTRPIELVTASEMLLLIAEAAAKGWNTGSYTAESAFAAGVKAHMTLLSGYSGLIKSETPSREQPNMDITAQEMDNYLATNPFGSDYATRKKRIAEEMYIAMYMNPAEGMFNVIRMGLELPKNAGIYTMPRRHAYAQNERANNYDQLSIAMTRRGIRLDINREDELLERNWWDVVTKK